MSVVGETQIGGDSSQAVLALHHLLEGELDAQSGSELRQTMSGLLTEQPAEMVRRTAEQLGQVDDPRDCRIGHQRCAGFIGQTTAIASS